MLITLDERGCGQGKTTDGIYKRIHKNHKNNIKTLVVVPNLALQKQYEIGLGIPVHIINSDSKYDDNTTVKATRTAMEQGTNLIIITHQTFVRLPFWSYRKDYDLIIDEAIEDVIRYNEIKNPKNGNWNPVYDLGKLFKLADENAMEIVNIVPNENKTYFEINQIQFPDYGLLSSNESFQSLTDMNYTQYVTALGYNILNEKATGVIRFISVLNPSIFKGYRSIHIAASAFNYTKMYHWMKSNNIFTQTQNSFKKHNSTLKFWVSDRSDFHHTGYKRKKMPQIMDRFHKFVTENSKGKVIALRNKDEKRTLPDEIKVSHSVHGLNDPVLQSCTDISLESTLLFNPVLERFIKDNWLRHCNCKNEVKKAIIQMHSGYLFYQVIMRTKLRNRDYDEEEINIFVPDQDFAVCLMEYFSHEKITDELISIITEDELNEIKKGRPKKPIEEIRKRRAERNKRHYLTQKAKKRAEKIKTEKHIYLNNKPS
jgi:hypothetical protein